MLDALLKPRGSIVSIKTFSVIVIGHSEGEGVMGKFSFVARIKERKYYDRARAS